MRAIEYNGASSTSAFQPHRLASLSVVCLLVSACGGGGGGGASNESGQGVDPPIANTPDASQALVINADAFLFRVGPEVASDGALDTMAGGKKLSASWNPGREQMLTPGMKVSFFGRASGCAPGVADGPVSASALAPDMETLSRMALAASQAGFIRDWQPAGLSEQCDAASHGALGPSRVVLNSDSSGGMGLYTTADTQGAQPFFGPYDAKGQDGKGTNAYNTSSFVTFRMDWRLSPRRPWVQSDSQQSSVARIHTRQSIGTATASAPEGASQPVQAKQFLSVAFINNACVARGITPTRPCAVKYLFPTTIVQAGVADWSQVSWFGNARVWFDPVQGGMPIIEGSPPARGAALRDVESGLSMFSSAGAAAKHTTFSDQAFDVRVSFEQLKNALRIVTARQAGVGAGAVADAQVADTWGAAWNDPTQWSLVTVAVGQEVHNPYSQGVSQIGGTFSSVYVGPQL